MSKLLDSSTIFYFILFFYFWRVGRTKVRHLSSQSSCRKMLRSNWCWKGKKNALICSHYALWILKKKKRRAFSITKYRQYWLNLLSIFRQSGLHCDSNLVKENALYWKACGPWWLHFSIFNVWWFIWGGWGGGLSIYESWWTRVIQEKFMWGWPHLLRN